MKRSRERNILIAVLSVAGLGLMFDRVIIGSDATTPAESSAGMIGGVTVDPSSLLVGSDQPGQAAPAGAATTAEAVSLAYRLRQATGSVSSDNTSPSRDAFVPPKGWLPKSGPNNEAVLSSAVESFKRDNRLDAVMLTGDRRCAVVSGRTVYLGQTLHGYRLIAVHERSAEFEVDGEIVTLVIRSGEQSS